MFGGDIYSLMVSADRFVSEHNDRMDEWKERILRQWEESKQYPRKKKKEIRKRLKLEYAIASYDVFDFKF